MKLKILFRIFYILIISAIFVTFRNELGIDLYRAVIYTAVGVLCIVVIDLISNGATSYRVISSFIYTVIFLLISLVVMQSFSWLFEDEAIKLMFVLLMIYMGILIGYRNHKFVENLFTKISIKTSRSKGMSVVPKVLDTSTLIDGRIANIVESDFIEGTLVIPVFVLKELQNIADSHDHLRRQKGRRGLNVMKRLQEQKNITIEIDNSTFDDIGTVDEKLITLAEQLGASVITTDFNLMKVAEIRNIKSLNLNNLAIAMRQTILPGEDLTISVTKEGKDPSQGIGYLDDGTMVVVENGRKNIGDKLKVEVTSLLQTESGRIIFTKMKAS